MNWPPAYDSFVAAPAGELPRQLPSSEQLEWCHKALQVLFMTLALIGLGVIFTHSGARAVLRGAAQKHAVA